MAQQERISDLQENLQMWTEVQARADAAARKVREKLTVALTSVLEWPTDHPAAPYAGSVYDFARKNNLNPAWLGREFSTTVDDVSKTDLVDTRQPGEGTDATDWYAYGVSVLCVENYKDKDDENLQVAIVAFGQAKQACLAREKQAMTLRYDELPSKYYEFLERYVPILLQVRLDFLERLEVADA